MNAEMNQFQVILIRCRLFRSVACLVKSFFHTLSGSNKHFVQVFI